MANFGDGEKSGRKKLVGKSGDDEAEAVVPEDRLGQERDVLSGSPLFFLAGLGVLAGVSMTYFSAVNGE